MIVKAAPRLAPDEAARRAAEGADPIWISSPGGARGAAGDVHIQFDVVAADPVNVLRGSSLEELEEAWRDAREAWSRNGARATPDIPVGIGWLSYDLARGWIPLAGGSRGDASWPLLEYRFFDAVWIREADAADARIVACDEAAARRLANRLADRLAMAQARESAAPGPTAIAQQEPANRPRNVLPRPAIGPLTAAGPVGDPGQPRADHARAVGAIKDYLCAGDAYQVNLARRLTATVSGGDPLWMATTLRARAPAPHAVWMGSRSSSSSSAALAHGPAADGQGGGTASGGAPVIDRYLVGNSPERFLRLTPGGEIETRPIKGTRPRGADAAADAAARAQLAASSKDRAEHVMIVDLERNDLGRVCETGSVVVEDLLRLVELPTVYHLVSTVRGRLRREVGLRELLLATFPGGSVTGAPKRRAMEIIEELEPVRRGLYTGATGWLGAAGDLDLAVAIRTATVSDGQLSLSVGGGIVVDSDAESEWEETEVKARAFLQLCQASQSGSPD